MCYNSHSSRAGPAWRPGSEHIFCHDFHRRRSRTQGFLVGEDAPAATDSAPENLLVSLTTPDILEGGSLAEEAEFPSYFSMVVNVQSGSYHWEPRTRAIHDKLNGYRTEAFEGQLRNRV